MRTIHKYHLQLEGVQTVDMPLSAEILHVGLDPQGAPCLWAIVETEMPTDDVTIYIVGTGHPMPTGCSKHLGSFVQTPFVWHVFLG